MCSENVRTFHSFFEGREERAGPRFLTPPAAVADSAVQKLGTEKVFRVMYSVMAIHLLRLENGSVYSMFGIVSCNPALTFSTPTAVHTCNLRKEPSNVFQKPPSTLFQVRTSPSHPSRRFHFSTLLCSSEKCVCGSRFKCCRLTT